MSTMHFTHSDLRTLRYYETGICCLALVKKKAERQRERDKRENMSAVTRQIWKGATSLFGGSPTSVVGSSSRMHHQVQWWRGIRVRVLNGNLEQALAFMTRKMVSSGIERLITRQPTRHIKNSEKRVLARKNLEHRIRSQDLARKLRSILIKKVRYFLSRSLSPLFFFQSAAWVLLLRFLLTTIFLY